jgi:hypothetical protein
MRGIGWATALVAAAFAVSCDKGGDLPEERPWGEEVMLQIRSLEVADGGEADFNRAASAAMGKEDFVSRPVGDGLLLEMRLEREGDASLRAVKLLQNGAYFQVIAIDYSTQKYISHGLFQAGGSGTDPNLHVPLNGHYRIICISYNRLDQSSLLDLSGYNRESDMSAVTLGDLGDLLWWTQELTLSGSAPAALSILLDYKVARLRVVIDCSYNEWLISGIGSGATVGAVAAPASVNLITGGVSGGAAGDQSITWPSTGMGRADFKQPSDSIVVVPTASNASLTVTLPKDLITRQSPMSKIPTTSGTYVITSNFSTPLEAGKSYSLHVKLRAPKWAGSNVYWVWNDKADHSLGGYMMFDVYGDTDNEGFQGVMFKWGSLVGAPPLIDYSSNGVYDTAPVYIPDGSNGWTTHIYYDQPNQSGPNWNAIPYWDHATYGDVIDNTHADDKYLGDICKYIRPAAYRLPKPEEFGVGTVAVTWDAVDPMTVPVAGGWVKGTLSWPETPSSTGGTDDGQHEAIDAGWGYVTNQTMNVTLPASGYMDDYGTTNFLGYQGRYWSSMTASNTNQGMHLVFSPFNTNPTGGFGRDRAFPVRCVVDD